MSDTARALDQLLLEIAGRPATDGAGFTCSPEGEAWRLGIWGKLASGWAGNVSLQCCAARIGIVEGEVLRLRDAMWAGTFLLAAPPGGANPEGFDFLQMARRRPSVLPRLPAPEITDIAVEQPADRPWAIVRIAGRDRLGFLAGLLDRIAACELEPQRISLHTTPDGVAHDRFVLRGIDGAPPKAAALARLTQILRRG